MKLPTAFLALTLSAGAASAASFDLLAKTDQTAGPIETFVLEDGGDLFIEDFDGWLSINLLGADFLTGDLFFDDGSTGLGGTLHGSRFVPGGAELLFTVDFDDDGVWGSKVLATLSLSGFDPDGASFLDFDGELVDVQLDAVQPIPLPAAGWLLVSAVATLGSLGVVRQYRDA